MFNYLKKILRIFNTNGSAQEKQTAENSKDDVLSAKLADNIHSLRKILGHSKDLVFREFLIGQKFKGAVIFLDGMVEKTAINNSILTPLMHYSENAAENNLESIERRLLSIGDVKREASIDELVYRCLSGDTILLLEGQPKALLISTQGWESRGITEPLTEVVVRGPREGFTETLRSNTTLLRRKIKNPNLTFENFIIGKQTRTEICIAYLKGIVMPGLVEEVKKRLRQIDTDAILESGYIEQYIEDNPLSPFSSIGNSEKPDVIAAKILEGRTAIFVDGTPIVLTAPMLFVESFQSAEDYYSRPYYSSIVRSLRFLAFFISILGPAGYVALTSYHHELIPTPLLLTMAASREGTPFPALIEAGLMGIAFEILREAGIRLPRPVGQAISIVGALVIGEAAVSAGLITAPMVIVVAVTAIASFVVPAQADVGSVLRILLLILAGLMGMFGITIGLLLTLVHICSLRSFGVPYFAPFAPLIIGELKDTFIRAPLWSIIMRPRTVSWRNPKRKSANLKPHPPDKDDN